LLSKIGLGLRQQHYDYIEADQPVRAQWFEVLTDNYLYNNGRPRRILEKIASKFPIACHGVSLSIGSATGPQQSYLRRVRDFITEFDPQIVSDHLCFCGDDKIFSHDLLPLNFTPQTLRVVVGNVRRVQDFFGRRIALENVSSYLTYKDAMHEWEFLATVAEKSDCDILLDINNIFVNAHNFKFDPIAYLKHIDAKRVVQYHLAGHTKMGSWLFDTHSGRATPAVWRLYREALRLIGDRPVLFEWDEDVPSFRVMETEAIKALKFIETAQAETHEI